MKSNLRQPIAPDRCASRRSCSRQATAPLLTTACRGGQPGGPNRVGPRGREGARVEQWTPCLSGSGAQGRAGDLLREQEARGSNPRTPTSKNLAPPARFFAFLPLQKPPHPTPGANPRCLDTSAHMASRGREWLPRASRRAGDLAHHEPLQAQLVTTAVRWVGVVLIVTGHPTWTRWRQVKLTLLSSLIAPP
jgi:hypothetical protein